MSLSAADNRGAGYPQPVTPTRLSSTAVPFSHGMYYDVRQDPSLIDRYLGGVSRWLGRVLTAQTGENVVQKLVANGTIPEAPKVELNSPNVKPLSLVAKGSIGWGELLGIDGSPLTALEKNYATRSWPNFQRYLSKRFNAPRVTVAQAGGLRRVVPQLAANNFKGLVTALEQGKWLTAGSTLLGMGLLALGVVNETKDGYERAKRDETDRHADSFSTVGKTALSFVKAGAKAGVAWEAGTIGFKIGSVLGGPLGALAGTATGVAVGGLASLATKASLDGVDHAVFGDPKNDLYA